VRLMNLNSMRKLGVTSPLVGEVGSRSDPGEGLCSHDRPEPLTPTLSHKGRGGSPPLLKRRAFNSRIARLALASLLAIVATSVACADDLLKAKLGVLRLSSSAPVFMAQDKGYFRDAGLDIELKFFDAAQPIAVASTSGDIDFGITAFTAGLYNLAGKGTLKVIGGMSREKAGYPLIGYFASNNAYAAGLKTPKDLAGKRVAVTQVGSSFHYSLGLLADKYGFKLSEVKVLPMQSLSNAAAALKGETVDAALLPVSTARKLMDDGGARLLGWVGDETPWQLGAVFASPRTLTNKSLVTKLLSALARADREYHDVILAAVKDGNASINAQTRPLLEIIAKYTNLPVEQVVGNCAYIDPDGRLDVKNVGNQIEWLQQQGFVDKGFTADAIIAKEYVKQD
jgi:NitT/TauT family transport system substrate-binding protein